MKTGVPWQVTGVGRRARETAREAARRSGMSVGEWLDNIITDSAGGQLEPGLHDEARFPSRRLPDTDDLLQHRSDEPLPPGTERHDTFAQRLDRLASRKTSLARADAPQDEDEATPREIVDAISRLDGRLEQLITEGRSATSDIERRMAAVDRAVANLGRDRDQAATRAPADPLDQALLEIAERQRALEAGEPSRRVLRAPTQDLSGLERQLREITSRVESLRPCGIEQALDTFRDDLAEIGLILKEALPRQALDSLEREIRALAERVDSKRRIAADGTAIDPIEQGLAEVRDALRTLTPAENVAGLDETVRQLALKVDRMTASGPDAGTLEQLETAIVGLRSIVSHVASSDALAKLSEEVRVLAARVEQIASPDILATLEQRIAAMTEALQSRHAVGSAIPDIDAVVRGLTDKLERLQLTRSDQVAVSHLEDRIAKLIERLDASDARLGHLEAVERGLAELLVHFEHQRGSQLGRSNASDTGGIDSLKREVQRTQDSLEAVHGTLGHVVDRLAVIETGIRGAPAAARETTATGSSAPFGLSEPLMTSPPTQPGIADHPLDVLVTPMATSPARPSAPARPADSPVVTAERRPIDPGLPPDHPLEPGIGAARARGHRPVDRIAASEAALGPANPAAGAEPSGRSNFIAAARRAAQAANNEMSQKRASAADSLRADRKLKGGLGKRARSLIVAASVIVIVLGSLQLAMTLFGIGGEPDAGAPAQGQSTPTGALESGLAPRSSGSIEALPSSPPPASRQSGLAPDNIPFAPPTAGLVLPPDPFAGEPTGSVPSPPAPRPGEATSAGPRPSAGANDADRLPAGLGSSALRAAAVRGNPAAEYEVGVRFAEGRGVPQDLSAAAEWFGRAAKQGIVPAQFRLGALYEKGLGVKKDAESARRLYLSASQAGNAKAMHNLAVLFAEGIDGKPDYQSAAQWFRRAADHGVADSQYNLGILYARGIGVESDLGEAYKWFALAAREGDAEAAKKRDDVGARLDPSALAAARAAAQAWTAQPQPEAATEVAAPAGGWDSAEAPAGKRRAGPKAEAASASPAQ